MDELDRALSAELLRWCREGNLERLRYSFYYEKDALAYFAAKSPRGNTLLHEAVDADKPDVVQLLIQSGVPPDIRGRNNQTPLLMAASKGHVTCVQALLMGGADVMAEDDFGHNAISKAERSRQKRDIILRLLRSRELVYLASRTDNHIIEKRLSYFASSNMKPEKNDIEEALFQAVLAGAEDNIAPLVLAGARRLDCALYLAIQQEHIKAIAMLLLCKATIAGDCQAIRSLISEPTNSTRSPWYLSEVQKLLSQGTIKMYCPIAVSIMVKNYDATKELLLCTDLDMRRKQVDWSRLKLTLLHPSWIYSIAPWVVNLKLGNNHLRYIPDEFSRALQLRRLDLSSNLIEKFSADIFALQNLESLNLSQNKIRELPDNIRWSPSLVNLDLSSNFLCSLPNSIQFSMLEILQLSKNKFQSVPKCVCRIRTLTTLDISSMPISSLPKEIDMLEKLANLIMTDCNIQDLPQGANPVGTRLVRAFVKSRSRSTKPSNFMKLVILSNSSVGKLVLYSRLRQIICPPGSHLPEMDFFQWTYRPFKLFGPKVMYNTWMIGIQKEHHLLYPCLYTANALYILVWDMTKTGDIQHQLKPYIDGISRCYPSANILVIAILPEPFDSWADANSNNLSKKLSALFTHPSYQRLQFHGFIALSNFTSAKEDSVDIRMRIHEVATQMVVNGAHVIGRQYPENYFNLIPVVDKEHTNLRTSGRSGIMEEDTLWSMFENSISVDMPDRMEFPVIMSFLQEIGYLMHFDDPNSRLNQYYFLHPEWVISTIHRILHHLHYHHASYPIVSAQKLSALMKVGSKNISSAMVRLMIRYDLLLPTSDKLYLIPSLLPHNSPPLAILQTGCYRRQMIPKGKSLPENFWYHMISSILFHLQRVFSSNDQIIKSLLRTSEEKLRSDSKSSVEILEIGEEDHHELNVIEQSAPMEHLSPTSEVVSKPRSMTDQHDGTFELIQKAGDKEVGVVGHRGRSKVSSPIKSLPRTSNDPVEISRGILVWSTGIQFTLSGKTKVSVYSQMSDLGLEESGIEVCASRTEDGLSILARVCWFIQKLLEQRYPEFSHHIHASSQSGLTQIILCPSCLSDQNLIANGGVTNFIIETCLVALKEKDSYSHSCHHHTSPIPLKQLVPEYILVDLPETLRLESDQFSYQESRPVYRDNMTMLCEGSYNGQLVTVKKHLFVETKSYTVPYSALRQEVEMLTSLSHPNIVRTFGFCLTPPVILLEKSPHGTLLQKLSDNEQKIGRLVRFHIARQVASALAYLHQNNIVYRTLKSDSILTWSLDFEDDVSVKLAHFDRAELYTPTGLHSRAEFSFYPAPEMLRYEFREEYTEKVDIYSFGVLLYELVARWQPFASNKTTLAHRPKLTGLSTYGFQTLVKLMDKCWEEDMTLRPTASNLVETLSNSQFQCHLSTQTLRDCISVRGSCFIPSLRQVWAYGEYNVFRENSDGTEFLIEGTQVFILNAANLTVQGSLELKERANAICTVDSKVWIGMLETCIHVYDSTTFSFTNRIFVKDSVTHIATNDKYAFVGLANGTLTYYEKLKFPDVSDSIKIGEKAIISMIPVGECLWVICGNEIVIVCADDDNQINVTHRLTACQHKDQVYELVLSNRNMLVWSIIRGSLTLICWDVDTCTRCGSLDLSDVINSICKSRDIDSSNIRLLSLECSQDVVWVGVSVGVVILLTATPQPQVITWFAAHRNAVRCLMTIPDLSGDDFEVVLSGGFGEESYIKTDTSADNGAIMSWQSLSSRELQLLANRDVSL